MRLVLVSFIHTHIVSCMCISIVILRGVHVLSEALVFFSSVYEIQYIL